MEVTDEGLTTFFASVSPLLDERRRRVVAGAVAELLGRGGVSAVSRATGLSRNTVVAGQRTMVPLDDSAVSGARIRAPGAGRKKRVDEDPRLLDALKRLVVPIGPAGTGNRPLEWTVRSTHNLSRALQSEGFNVGSTLVAELLRSIGFRLHATGGSRAEMRDIVSQLEYVAETVEAFIADGNPVVSLTTSSFTLSDTTSDPTAGSNDISSRLKIDGNKGVRVRIGQPLAGDPIAALATLSALEKWWLTSGCARYSGTVRALISVDAGLTDDVAWMPWQLQLAKVAAVTGLEFTVVRIPRVTYRWNLVEEETQEITLKSRERTGRSSKAAASELIATTITVLANSRTQGTTNGDGPAVLAFDPARLPLIRHGEHGNWNYTVFPNPEFLEPDLGRQSPRSAVPAVVTHRTRDAIGPLPNVDLDPRPDRRQKVMSVAEQIAHQVARDISDRKLQPGMRLFPEAETTERLGVSRSSLREALRMLELLGVITVRPGPGGGPTVNQITSADFGSTSTFYFHIVGVTLRQLLEARSQLEPLLVRIAAERHDPLQMQRLSEVQQGRVHVQQPAWVAPKGRIGDVHGLLILTGNPILDFVSRSLQEVWLHRISSIIYPSEIRAQLDSDHDMLARAIVDGNGPLAEGLMRRHEMFTREFLEDSFPDLLSEIVDWA